VCFSYGRDLGRAWLDYVRIDDHKSSYWHVQIIQYKYNAASFTVKPVGKREDLSISTALEKTLCPIPRHQAPEVFLGYTTGSIWALAFITFTLFCSTIFYLSSTIRSFQGHSFTYSFVSNPTASETYFNICCAFVNHGVRQVPPGIRIIDKLVTFERFSSP
jgi:hypothetical protein